MSEAEGAQGRARRALTGTSDPDPRGPSTMRPGGEGGEPVPGRERGRATSETWEGPPARGDRACSRAGQRQGGRRAGATMRTPHEAPGQPSQRKIIEVSPHVSARPGIIRQPVLGRPSEPLIHQEEP